MMACTLSKSYLKTELGFLTVIYCKNGVHAIKFTDPENCDLELRNYKEDYEKSKVSKQVITWLELYFKHAADVRSESYPPICPSTFSSKSSFRTKVWKTLMTEVPPGKTISYGHLAALCGNKSASRAVGAAMKANPLPILIPCHRVVKSDGTVGYYSGGIDKKEFLLDHEHSLLK